MKRLVFLLVVLVSLNASGQRFFDYRTQNTSTQAQAKLRQIEQHNRLLQNAVQNWKPKHTKHSPHIVARASTENRSDSLLNVLLKSLKNSRLLPIDSAFHNADSTRLDSIGIDSTAVDSLPWFKPYVRTRLPHGVD